MAAILDIAYHDIDSWSKEHFEFNSKLCDEEHLRYDQKSIACSHFTEYHGT